MNTVRAHFAISQAAQRSKEEGAVTHLVLCYVCFILTRQVKEYFLNTYNLDEGIFAGIKG